MSYNLLSSELISTITRKSITGNDTGLRSIGYTPLTDANGHYISRGGFDTKGSPLDFISEFDIKGFITSIGIAILKSGIVKKITNFLVQTGLFLYSFNWNASDKELDQLLDSLKILIAGQLGATLGNTAGYIICGGIPTATVFFFNDYLALEMLASLGEKALEELWSNLNILTSEFLNYAFTAWLINSYKSVRKFIRDSAKDPNSWTSVIGKRIFGKNFDKMIKAWGAEGGQPWTFADQYQKWLDDIKDPNVQNFTQEFFQSLVNSCIESLYYVSDTLDAEIVKHFTITKPAILGQETITVIKPDRKIPDEQIIVYGREELAKTQIVQALGVDYPMIENRNIGTFVGEPLIESFRKIKGNERNYIAIRIVFYNRPTPPWYIKGVQNKVRKSQITIPHVNRSKIVWEDIKTWCKGTSGYEGGGNKVTAHLIDDDGVAVTQMSISCATQEDGTELLESLIHLSHYKIAKITYTGQSKKGTRGTVLYKDPIKMYPAYMVILNTQKIQNEQEGRTEISGSYTRQKEQIPLWLDKMPDNFETIVEELLTTHGSNG